MDLRVSNFWMGYTCMRTHLIIYSIASINTKWLAWLRIMITIMLTHWFSLALAMTHVQSVPCHFIEYHCATYNRICLGMVPQMFCLYTRIYIDLLLYIRICKCRPINIYGILSSYMCSAPHSCCVDISCLKARVLSHQTLFWWRQPSLRPSQGVSQCVHGKAKKLWLLLLYTFCCLFSVAGCLVRKEWYLPLWGQW